MIKKTMGEEIEVEVDLDDLMQGVDGKEFSFGRLEICKIYEIPNRYTPIF